MAAISGNSNDQNFENLDKEANPSNSEGTSPFSIEEQQRAKKQKAKERRKRQRQMSGKNVGHWNLREKRLYYTFLTLHERHFLRNELRRSDKVFRSMSHYIGTRAADQCRSHHQKMQKKYKTFENILKAHQEDLQELAKEELANLNARTQQGLERFPDAKHALYFMSTQERALFQLPSLLLEAPITMNLRLPSDVQDWPLQDVFNDIDC